MKRFISASLVILLMFLFGCGGDTPEIPQSPTETSQSSTETMEPPTLSLDYPIFYDAFCSMLTPLDDFTISPLSDVEIDDGVIVKVITITDTLLNRLYHMRTHCAKDGTVRSVVLSADKRSRTDISFSVLTLYIYESLGLPAVDPDTFYDDFGLLANEDRHITQTVDNWDLSCLVMSEPNLMTFYFQNNSFK